MDEYRAVDKDRDTIDCYFAKNRGKKATVAFLKNPYYLAAGHQLLLFTRVVQKRTS